MHAFDILTGQLLTRPHLWTVTGAAGFIGSNLVEALLNLNQRVTGLDNFSTGSKRNLEQVRASVGPARWKKFVLVEGDTCDPQICRRAARHADFVLHQAALGSVPRSIANPQDSHASNVTGFLNMMLAARDEHVKRFVFASSSSVYGDNQDLPKCEDRIGRCLSPYALTKRINELYADVLQRCYGLDWVGLRYFNVFGPRQDPQGPYAAVIPKWIFAFVRNQPIYINGDGETSRDFCYVANVVQANLLAAAVKDPVAVNQLYNVAVHARTTLNRLYALLHTALVPFYPHLTDFRPIYRDFRAGDVRHSQADISKAIALLGYQPSHTIEQGLAASLGWYLKHLVAPLRMDNQPPTRGPSLSRQPQPC